MSPSSVEERLKRPDLLYRVDAPAVEIAARSWDDAFPIEYSETIYRTAKLSRDLRYVEMAA